MRPTKHLGLVLAFSLVTWAAFAAQPVTPVDKSNTHSMTFDSSNNVNVNCQTGCTGGGGSSNATIVAPLGSVAPASGVATTLDTTDAAALQSIVTNTGGAIPAGGNKIGSVAIDQTTPGTTNAVFVTNGSSNPTTVIVNTPPNDVLQGPTTISSPADQIVSSQGSGSVGLQITGTCTSLSGLVRGSVDGTNYFNIPAFNSTSGTAVVPGTAITGTGSWFIPAAGWQKVEFHPTALTASCTFSLNASAGSIQPLITASGASAVDILGVNGATVSTGNGTADTHTMRVAVASNNTPFSVNPAAATTGGCTPYHLSGGTAASNNSTNIKNAAGTLCKMTPINTTATIYYLKLYNTSSAPTCSSATGLVHVYPIPANSNSTGSGFMDLEGAFGEAYGTGISFCVTGGGGDTDNSNAATGVYIEASYK